MCVSHCEGERNNGAATASVVVLGLGLEQKSLALAKQVLGLAGLVICQTNNTVTMLKSTFIA